MRHRFVNEDCYEFLCKTKRNSVDIVVTSPPYNIGVNYNTYNDNRNEDDFYHWLGNIIVRIRCVLKDDGSFFLNFSGSVSKMQKVWDIYDLCRKHHFVCQNHIIWVKSIFIPEVGHQFGHFKPVNSKRFLNNVYEPVFHFTHEGKVEIDKLSIGSPYSDKSNINRWGSKVDKKCKGNVWFIPYETKNTSSKHPASYPPELAKQCILMTGKKKPVVLDPFGGIGSTAMACEELGCRCISVELDKEYHDIAIERVKNFRKKKTKREYQ